MNIHENAGLTPRGSRGIDHAVVVWQDRWDWAENKIGTVMQCGGVEIRLFCFR
jgi:hypothetical protein